MLMYTADRVAGLIPCGLSEHFDVFHPIQVSRCIHMSSHGLKVHYSMLEMVIWTGVKYPGDQSMRIYK